MNDRKLRRKKAKKKEKEAKKEMAKKVGLFLKVPDQCTSCSAKFDKKSKAHVQSWRVTVIEEEELVTLYCPFCWEAMNSG